MKLSPAFQLTTLKAEWEYFENQLPPTVSPLKRRALRIAFYSGCYSVLNPFRAASHDPKAGQEQAKIFEAECEEFSKEEHERQNAKN